MQACGSLEENNIRPRSRKRTEANHGTEAKSNWVRDHLFQVQRKRPLFVRCSYVASYQEYCELLLILLPLTGHQRLEKRGETSCSVSCPHTCVVYCSHTFNTSLLCHCLQIQLDTTFSEIRTGAKSCNVRLLYGM